MRRIGARFGVVSAAAGAMVLLAGTPSHAATMRWERPCDYSCQQHEMALSPGLPQLVHVEVRIPLTAGLFNLTTCSVGGSPRVGCIDRGFSIGSHGNQVSGSTGCQSVNTYATGTQKVGPCAIRSAVDPTRAGRAPVSVTTAVNTLGGNACVFAITPAAGLNDDGAEPDIVFVDAANYHWRVTRIEWTAENNVDRPGQGGTRWLTTQVTILAELGGRTLTLNMSGRTESSSPCSLGFPVTNFLYDVGGAGTVG